MIHLVIGGARSGKSSFAEHWCLQKRQSTTQLHYIATATVTDEEMAERVRRHQQARDSLWQLTECPLHLAAQLHKLDKNGLYLVDCLTLWLNNTLFNLDENASYQTRHDNLTKARAELLKEISSAKTSGCTLVLVSNEVGLGITPMGEISRLFVDHAGWLNQEIAKMADSVTLLSAGIPLTLKPSMQGQSY